MLKGEEKTVKVKEYKYADDLKVNSLKYILTMSKSPLQMPMISLSLAILKCLKEKIMSECYLVYYKDNFGNYECEYFGPERREDAIKYYKQRKVLISQELKDWVEEEGIYRCVWRKDTEFRELYFKVKED